eukprot:TRINITY_DN8825_c1_g1_i1.p1 TRINITY_DN8825_c1_g1~~TRINITY_DN8825_c1_g1_i1.p1  ORF type:complete len:382 (+),score=85.19 TRINITY_DN8825_c1_g1_i1:21-1166(+)
MEGEGSLTIGQGQGLGCLPSDIFDVILDSLDMCSLISFASSCKGFCKYLCYEFTWKKRFLREFQYWKVFVDDNTPVGTTPTWKDRTIASWKSKMSIAIIYAFTNIYEPTSVGEYLNRSTCLLRKAGFTVHPVLIKQNEFTSLVLKGVEETLKGVSTVLFFSNGYFQKDDIWDDFGSLLAEFVLSGKNVVVGTYGNCTEAEAPGGEWRDLNLNPIELCGQVYEIQEYKPTIEYSPPSSDTDEDTEPYQQTINKYQHEESAIHPILKGVHFFHTRNNVANGLVHPDAEVISRYQSGRPMAVWLKVQRSVNGVSKSGGVLSINIVPAPGDADIVGGWQNESKDPSIFVINSIAWALNNEYASKLIGRRKIPYDFTKTIKSEKVF